MAMEPTSATRTNPILAAGAIMALGATLMGCQANSAALMYAEEAHAQQVAAWCRYAIVGRWTESLQEQCIRQVWINVPPGECFINSCTYDAPYYARRVRIDK